VEHLGARDGFLWLMRHAPHRFYSGVALVDDVASAEIVAQVEHRVASEALHGIRLLFHVWQRCVGNIGTMRVGAVIQTNDGDASVGDEGVSGGVFGIARNPGPVDVAHAIDAAGQPEIVDHLATLFIDMFVDETDQRLGSLVDADPRIMRGRRGEDRLAIERAGLGVDAQVVTCKEGVERFGDNQGRGLAIQDERGDGTLAVSLVFHDGAHDAVLRLRAQWIGWHPARGIEGFLDRILGSHVEERDKVGRGCRIRGFGAEGQGADQFRKLCFLFFAL
jgi:hypothetical protein